MNMDESDVLMSSFLFNGVVYGHYINTDDDGTFFINENELDRKLLTVDCFSNLKINNTHIGVFSLTSPDYKLWRFVFENGEIITGTDTDLIKFEVKVFQNLVEKGLIK